MRFDVLRRESWTWLAVGAWMVLPAAAVAQPSSPTSPAALAAAGDDAPPPIPGDPSQAADVLVSDLPTVQRAFTAEPHDDRDSAAPARLPGIGGSAPLALKADQPAPRALAPVDAASLKGVHPGHTSREQLHSQWGNPKKTERIAGGVRETYDIEPFDHVRVTIVENVVDSVTIRLQKPIAAATLVDRLQVGDVEPVDVYDDQGQLLGQSYPERGVLFGFTPGSDPPHVFQMVLEPINAQPFLARAEIRLPTRYDDCVADLKQAHELAPESGRTHWLHAELSLRAGELSQGLESAKKAVALEPREFEYRLTLAKLLAEKGDYAQASEYLRKMVEGAKAPPIVAAKAYCQWGDCVAAGPRHDYHQAYQHHQQAIKLAEPLADSPEIAVRRAAKTVLVDAELAVAHDVGWGRWQNKSQALAKWLDKALAQAEDVVERDRAGSEVRLRVYEGALSAIAGLTDPPEASQWIQGATQLGAHAFGQAADAGYKAHLAWRLGAALTDAMEIETAHAHPEQALALGKSALAYFEQGEPCGKQLPTHDLLRGRLCYRLGAIFASEQSDHKQARAWFDQAVPLLESKSAVSAAVNTARQGETYVSMAVSYWEVSNRAEALRLTQQGVKLMEQAADDGKLDKSALVVAYRNLASMHQQLGNAPQARHYAELAARNERPTKKTSSPTGASARPAIKR
jgi:tetratricopeptide (TPR) repeat protein